MVGMIIFHFWTQSETQLTVIVLLDISTLSVCWLLLCQNLVTVFITQSSSSVASNQIHICVLLLVHRLWFTHMIPNMASPNEL